jgi:hypothetical protein
MSEIKEKQNIKNHVGFITSHIYPTLVESKNVENTGETFLAHILTHKSPPTPSFLFSTFLLSTKVGFIVFYGFLGNSIKPRHERYRMSMFCGTHNERNDLCVNG